MFGSQILEVAIGVIFIYILVSIICTAVREIFDGILKTRAAYLERGIRELLRDVEGTGIARSFYEHPLIDSLYSGTYRRGDTGERIRIFASGRGMPSYIPAKNFALVLLDLAARGRQTDARSSGPAAPRLTLQAVRENVATIENPGVQRVLLTAVDTAQDDLDRAVANLEAWFDSGMDRVSGWYKRSSQWIVFGTALMVAVGLNVDTLAIADHLYRHDAAREVIVARAEAAVEDTAFLARGYREARDDLTSLQLPIGWSYRAAAETPPGSILTRYLMPPLGWLLTALAATLGAPFWFDVLNKVIVIRSTVKPREKSPEEKSEDGPARPRPLRAAPVGAADGPPPPEG
jgi:hypothetical protein